MSHYIIAIISFIQKYILGIKPIYKIAILYAICNGT